MIPIESLDSIVINKKPNDVETLLYLFWEVGIGYEEFIELPIPYILSIMKVKNFVTKEEIKAQKKAARKK